MVFNFDLATKFHTELKNIKEGSQLNIITDNSQTSSLPPQMYALEVYCVK